MRGAPSVHAQALLSDELLQSVSLLKTLLASVDLCLNSLILSRQD